MQSRCTNNFGSIVTPFILNSEISVSPSFILYNHYNNFRIIIIEEFLKTDDLISMVPERINHHHPRCDSGYVLKAHQQAP